MCPACSAPTRARCRAQLMTEISCDEMLELASLGASVLHPRAVEIARNYGVAMVVRSSWSGPGTLLTSRRGRPLSQPVWNLAAPWMGWEQLEHQAVRPVPYPGPARHRRAAVRKPSDAGINVDLIIQSTHDGSKRHHLHRGGNGSDGRAHGEPDGAGPLGGELASEGGMTKLSISGAGIMGRPGIAADCSTACPSRGSTCG